MDGVITDFATAAATLFNQPQKGSFGDDPPTDHDGIHEHYGINCEEFWSTIDNQGSDFWANMPPLPWFDDLIKLVKSHSEEMIILSSPSRNADSSSGKVLWLQDKFGVDFRSYILCPSELKPKLAAERCLLIDDRPQNIDGFEANGGKVLMFPAPWNDLLLKFKHPMNYVRCEMLGRLSYKI